MGPRAVARAAVLHLPDGPPRVSHDPHPAAPSANLHGRPCPERGHNDGHAEPTPSSESEYPLPFY
jgi:hypothetical protein